MGWQEGRLVTMLASRAELLCLARPGLFPIQECREDSSKVGQPTKTRHICSRRFGRRSNEDVSPT